MRTMPFIMFFLIQLSSDAQVSFNLNSNSGNYCSDEEILVKSNISGSFDSTHWIIQTSGTYQILAENPDSMRLRISNMVSDSIDLTVLFKLWNNATFYKDSISVVVHRNPQIILNPDISLCCDYGPLNLDSFALGSSNPTGGTWGVPTKPTCISGDNFLPHKACEQTTNSIFVWYTHTVSAGTCTNSDSIKISVNPLPQIKMASPTYCQSIGTFDAENELVDIPGNTNTGQQSWSCIECNGNSIDSLMFDANGGVGGISTYVVRIGPQWYTMKNQDMDTVILEYTFINAYGCANKDTASFYIVRVPEVKFSSLRNLCWDEGEIDLNELTGVSPLNGIWTVVSAPGFRIPGQMGVIKDSSIIDTRLSTSLPSPTSNPNKFLIQYTHSATGCPAFNDTFLIINPLPKIVLPKLAVQICELQAPIDLNATPAGGIWTSSHTNVFIGGTPEKFSPQTAPKDEQITLTYSFLNTSTGCFSSDSIVLQVEQAPRVELPEDLELCRTHGKMVDTITVAALVAQNIPGNLNWSVLPTLGASAQIIDNQNLQISIEVGMQNDSSQKVLVSASSGFANSVCPISNDVTIISIHPIPDAIIQRSLPESCVPLVSIQSVQINNKINANSATYSWTSSSGSTINSQYYTEHISSSGEYNVNLKLITKFGCDTTLSTSLKVYPLPTAFFYPDPDNTATDLTGHFDFYNASTLDIILNTSITNYYWNFGDPNQSSDTSSLQNPSWEYNDTGAYIVSLIVETNKACRDTFMSEVVVIEHDSKTQMMVFPNPGRGNVNFYSPDPQIEGQSISVYDQCGKLVKTYIYHGKYLRMNLQDLAPGLYYVGYTGKKQKHLKLVIQ